MHPWQAPEPQSPEPRGLASSMRKTSSRGSKADGFFNAPLASARAANRRTKRIGQFHEKGLGMPIAVATWKALFLFTDVARKAIPKHTSGAAFRYFDHAARMNGAAKGAAMATRPSKENSP